MAVLAALAMVFVVATAALAEGKILQLRIQAEKRPVILTFHERLVCVDIELSPYDRTVAEKINDNILSLGGMKLFFSYDPQNEKESMFLRQTCKYYDFLYNAGSDDYCRERGRSTWIEMLCGTFIEDRADHNSPIIHRDIQEVCDRLRDNILNDYTGRINLENFESFQDEFPEEVWNKFCESVARGDGRFIFPTMEEKLNEKLKDDSARLATTLKRQFAPRGVGDSRSADVRQWIDDFLTEFANGNEIQWETRKDESFPDWISVFPYRIFGKLLRKRCSAQLGIEIFQSTSYDLTCCVYGNCLNSRQMVGKINFFQQFCFSHILVDEQKKLLYFKFSTRIGRGLTPSAIRDLIMTPINELCTWGIMSADKDISYQHPQEIRQRSFAGPAILWDFFEKPIFYLDSEAELMRILQELAAQGQTPNEDNVFAANMPPEIRNFSFWMQQSQSLSQAETEYYFY